MDLNNNHPSPTYPIVSILSTLIAWTFKDLQVVLGLFASLVAIVSGIMAIKYYWTAIEKLKNGK
jgi:hypothetical protein